MFPVAQMTGMRSLTPDELRTRLAKSSLGENKKEFLHGVVGSLNDADADAFERRIDELNEQVDTVDGSAL